MTVADIIGPARLSPDLPTPLYHQLYLVLRDRIRSGALAAGTLLPGEQDLAQAFGVSRITVKRSMNELAADGLVTRHRGRGTLVSGDVIAPLVKGSFDTVIESLHMIGLKTEVELLELAEVPADPAVAEHLALSPGDAVQRAVRRRTLSGEPFSYLISFVPRRIAERYSAEDLGSTALLALFERAGAAVTEAEQWITAVGAEPAIAAALGVDAGAPLLCIERVMRADKGEPVQLIYSHYRPDRFQYHVRAHRRREAGKAVWREEAEGSI